MELDAYKIGLWIRLARSYGLNGEKVFDEFNKQEYMNAISHYEQKEQIDQYFTSLKHNCKFFPSIAEAREFAGHPSLDEQKVILRTHIYAHLSTGKALPPQARDLFERIGGMNFFRSFDITAVNAHKILGELVSAHFCPVNHRISLQSEFEHKLALEAAKAEKEQQEPITQQFSTSAFADKIRQGYLPICFIGKTGTAYYPHPEQTDHKIARWVKANTPEQYKLLDEYKTAAESHLSIIENAKKAGLYNEHSQLLKSLEKIYDVVKHRDFRNGKVVQLHRS